MKNVHITIREIYSECVPSVIKIGRVLQKIWQNIWVCFFRWTYKDAVYYK